MSSTNLSHRSQLSITIIPKLSGFLSTLNPFRAVLGTTHDIYHLLLIGTAKFHTEPIHIVVYGQCLAALMIFAICYWLGLPRSTLTPSTSWCTGSAWPLSWYLPFTIDWICLLLSCIWDCFRAHDIYPQLIGTACRAHVFETACRAHDIYHSYWLGLLAALMYLRLLATLMIFIHHWLRLLAALMYLRLLAAQAQSLPSILNTIILKVSPYRDYMFKLV